uniref:Glycine-rich cell wall structural protein 1.8-like n=1 Tax=Kryptolebias marmoratus TaxID=37003 RepID=A0A3Q3A106_KRYMA
MRVLWISFLLIGSISCLPQQQGGGGGQPWWWFASSSGQDPSSPSEQKPTGQLGGSGSYSSYPGLYYSGTNTAGGAGGSYSGVQQHGGSQEGQQGAPGSGGPYQSTEESWSSSSDTSGEDEPVFTPVDDEDQVYAFKSRSRYNRKSLSET